MIIKYHPRYLKAILDRAKMDGVFGGLLNALEIIIRKKPELTYIALDEIGKFKAFITYAELPNKTVYCLHWSSKEVKYGCSVLRHSIKDLGKTYDEAYYHRKDREEIIRRRL